MKAETCDWADLQPGDCVRVSSRRGNEYELQVLARMGDLVYIRLNQGLARLYFERVQRLRRLDRGHTLLREGDHILAQHVQGYPLNGQLLTTSADRLTIARPNGDALSVPWDEVVADSLRLCFRAPNLKVGEEFTVQSRTGREYTGVLESVRDSLLSLRGAEGKSTLRAGRLDFYTLVVLIPIDRSHVVGGAHVGS